MPKHAEAPIEGQDTFWWRLVHLNPVLWKGLVVAVLAVLAITGVHISPQLPDVLDGLVLAVSAIVQALWTQTSVTPNAKVVVAVEDPHLGGTVVVPGEATTVASDAAILRAAATAGPDKAGSVESVTS